MKTANHIPFQRERRARHALRSFRGALSTPRGRQLAQNAVLLAVAVLALLALTLTEQFRAPQEDAVAGGADAAPPSEGGALPVLSIVTENGRLPNGEDLSARLTLLLPDGTEFQTISTRIEINERGNTSRRFPKKSYRVKIVDEEGQKQDLSIAGLRSDDDWILNPLYTDTSKIREALAYDLWARMNSSGQAAAGSRMRYAEIYFNGQYWGLYGVQERMDRKQVDADKRGGVLYKVAANDRPTVEELLDCTSPERCAGFELTFCGAGVKDPWEPAAAYMAFLEGESCGVDARLSTANVIDYGLWAMLTQAHDCHFKNQYLNCVYGNGYTLYKIPWDLNNTFGDVWLNAAEESNHTGYKIGDLVMDGAFSMLLDTGGEEALRAVEERWRELRRETIMLEGLLERAHELYAPLRSAIERDSARWPSCGMGNGNAANIRDIEAYFRAILPRMDAFVSGLAARQ